MYARFGQFVRKETGGNKNVSSYGEIYEIQELQRFQRHPLLRVVHTTRYLLNEIRKREA